MKDTLLDNLHMADINPRICGVEACAPGHSFGPAVREYFLLHYVVRGKGIFRRGKREYTLQAGEIFVHCRLRRYACKGVAHLRAAL